MFNAPGHMYTAVNAMNTLGVGGKSNIISNLNDGRTSNWAVDPTDATAVAFAKALLQKYVTYFAGKGSTMFNIGADESGLDKDNYASYAKMVNDMNAIVKAAGMTTLAYNDGIYRAEFASSQPGVKFDNDIVICYWTEEKSISVAEFLSKGFKILNNNGDWYYVLGDYLYKAWLSPQWSYQSALSNLQSIPVTKMMGYTGTEQPMGSILCVWCDGPSVGYTKAVNWGVGDGNGVNAYMNADGNLEVSGTAYGVEKIEGTLIQRTGNANTSTKFYPNGTDNDWSRAGLVETKLGTNGMPVYTDAAVRYVAGLLKAGYYNDVSDSDYNCNSYIYKTFVAEDGKRSIQNESATEFSAQFEVTKSYNDIKTAYDLAWYLLNTIYQPDTEATVPVTDVNGQQREVPLYGMAVDTYKSIVLTADGDKYTFKAGYKISDEKQYPEDVKFDKSNGTISNGGGDTNNLGFYPLEGLGYEQKGLLKNLPQAADASDLAAAMRAEYDVDEATALRDAQAFLEQLRQLDIISE